MSVQDDLRQTVDAPKAGRLVVPLPALGRDDLPVAGGKGANLGELARAGFPVPAGFVVTTAAYELAVATGALATSQVSEGDPGRDAADRRAAYASVSVPQELRQAVSDAYAALGGGAVSVRSSATAEDLPEAAFAGQQDTFLNVAGEAEVLDAVRRCWASLWTDRAVSYRRSRGIDDAEVRMAVVVQRMVEAELAGVLFTADPVSGNRNRVVIDASSGLGEAVVSGLVTPDHYVLDRRGGVQEWTPGRREVVIRSAAGGGVERSEGGSDHLPRRALRELTRLGLNVAGHFGRPQDVEWAYAEGRLWLLQARPMTALPPAPVRVSRLGRRILTQLVEYVPVRPYPLDVTTWWRYGPAGRMAEVVGAFGLHGVFESMFHETDGVVDRMQAPTPRLAPRALLAPALILAKALRHDPARWTDDPRFGPFVAAVRKLNGQDFSSVPWSELVGVPRRTLDLLGPPAALRIDYLPAAGVAVVRLAVLLTVLRRRAMLGDLLAGARTRTTDLNRALDSLAERVRQDPGLAAVLREDEPEWSAYPEFGSALDAFVTEYGHRETLTMTLASSPTLGEDRHTLLALITMLAGTAPERSRPSDALAGLCEAWPLRARPLGNAARRWVGAARSAIAFREDSHFYFTLPLPVLRRAVLEIGRRLNGVGVGDRPDDVFHLRLEELEELAGPDVSQLPAEQRDQLADLVSTRAARRAELSALPLVDPGLLVGPVRDETALVSGTPAGGGRATGPVRILRTPSEFGRLQPGDVLVCPYTNPAWTPLFQRAVAVVVDSGGLASHAAIVAREYGIPAVMGTRNATTTLSDGQLVTVDGQTGRVTPGPG